MDKQSFGKTSKGIEAFKYEIANSKGMRAELTDFGATVIALYVADRDGNFRDVILGYDDVATYEREGAYFGATVGRNANRISDAKIVIDGVEYQIEANDNENNLHSGSNGTSKMIWTVKNWVGNAITFECISKDLEQGFPGTATIEVTYAITENNELSISYHAVSDKTTVFNMTNHNYYNLNGQASGLVYDHELWINGSFYTPMKSPKAIPTGEIAPVEGTPFDFRAAKPIGKEIKADNEQLHFANGYDHNFAIDKTKDGIELAAVASSPESGIKMEVFTDCIGIQLYTANFIVGQVGKGGVTYADNGAFCLETQFFPNAINEANFATPITKAGEAYETKTIYKFTVE